MKQAIVVSLFLILSSVASDAQMGSNLGRIDWFRVATRSQEEGRDVARTRQAFLRPADPARPDPARRPQRTPGNTPNAS